MKVKELIQELENMPMDAEVFHVWDGEARTCIEQVWLSRKGEVMTSDHGEPVYTEENPPWDE